MATPNPNNIANREIIQRLNFLYQASAFLSNLSDPTASDLRSSFHSSHDGARKRRRYTTADLSRTYIESLKIVGKKTVVKIDPTVKRTICKGCNTVLRPGISATVRVKPSSSHGRAVTYNCTVCKTTRRIPAPPVLIPGADTSISRGREDASTAAVPMDSHITDATAEDNQARSSTQGRSRAHGRKKKPPPTSRVPPLFTRNVGHVIFCGNEKLEVADDCLGP